MADDSEDTAKIGSASEPPNQPPAPAGTNPPRQPTAPADPSPQPAPPAAPPPPVPPTRHSSEKPFPPPSASPAPKGVPLWSMIAVAVLALAGLVLSTIALLRSGSGSDAVDEQSTSTHAAEDPAAAKTRVCDAASTVRQAVIVNTNLPNPDPENPLVTLAVTTSARLALTTGGSYLHDVLDSAPAAPAEVASAVSSYADAIGSLGAAYLANNINPEQQSQAIHNVDVTARQMGQVCPMPEPPAAPVPAPPPGEGGEGQSEPGHAPGEPGQTPGEPGQIPALPGQAPAEPAVPGVAPGS